MSKILLTVYLSLLIAVFVFITCFFVKDEQTATVLCVIITSYFMTAYIRLNKLNFMPLFTKPHLIISIILLFMLPIRKTKTIHQKDHK